MINNIEPLSSCPPSPSTPTNRADRQRRRAESKGSLRTESATRARGRSSSGRRGSPSTGRVGSLSNSGRTSRRGSVDPYGKRLVAEPETGESAGEGEDKGFAEVEQDATDQEDRGMVASGSGSRDVEMREGRTASVPMMGAEKPLATAATARHMTLRVLQQPEIGTPAGLSRMSLGRLPIVPAPVVQVIVRNEDGEEV
ncbi:hypothetical protein P7C70_g1179, partial [Phenoliferia sp. Uapishka_3]